MIATSLLLAVGGAVGAGATQSGSGRPPLALGGYLQGSYGPAAVQRFVVDLARAGVPVYVPGSPTPLDAVAGRAAPLRLTLDQATAAARGIAAHAGMTGARLDSLVHLSRGRLVVPMGAIVAGWAKRARTPAGALARRILGHPDWRRYRLTVFPVGVLVLFAADVGLHVQGSSRAADRSAVVTAATTPCAAVDGFIRNAIDAFFRSIGHLSTDTGTIRRLFGQGFVGDIIAGIGDVLSWSVNAAVNSLHQIVINGYQIAIGTVTAALASIAGAAAVAGSVASALMPWAGAITATPNSTAKGIGTGIPGTLSLEVTAPGSDLQWPQWIVDCAAAFNIPLPTLTPKNADVTWDLHQQDPSGLIVERSQTGPLDAQGKGRLNFSTTAESPELAAGEPHIGAVVPFAHIHRTDLDELEQRLTDGLVAGLPNVVQSYVAPALRAILQPVLTQLQSKVSELRDLDVAGIVAVRYHTPAPPSTKKAGGGKHRPGKGLTELRYALPNACSLLSFSDVAAAIQPPIIAGPHPRPSGPGPYPSTVCTWGSRDPNPPGVVVVEDGVYRFPDVKTATRVFGLDTPGIVRVRGLGDEAYYIPAAEELWVRVANLKLNASTIRGDEGVCEGLMRAMLSHLPKPRRVPVR